MSKGTLKVTLVRSPISRPSKTKAWIAGLGLKRPNTSVILPDTPAVRGMLAKVSHMVRWSAVEGRKAPAPAKRRKAASPLKESKAKTAATAPKVARAKKEKA